MVTTDLDIDDVILYSDSDDEETDKKAKKKQHKKLLKDIDAISGVSKKKSRKTKRNEPSKEISEFAWSTGQDEKNKLELKDLVGSLETKTKKLASTKKKLRRVENSTKTLEKPLHKPEQQKIERIVAYEETAKDVSKWNPTVQKNREAEHLSFPLNKYKPPPISTKTLVSTFQPKNDLEREISEVLLGSQHVLERKGKELTQAEEEALKKFDLQEAMERRKELQRVRALQSYYETKCRRMKKIKSKKYHRILKKEQQKTLEKVDLEKLAKENPDLYQTELEKAEKMRALERANLRHRNTSKWAKNLITKGIKNKEDHECIREQLRISRQLTDHKAVTDSENDDDDLEYGEPNNENDKPGSDELHQLKLLTAEEHGNSDNPWLLGSKQGNDGSTDNDIEGSSKLRKPEVVVTTESKQHSSGKDSDVEDEIVSSGDEWEAEGEKDEVKMKTKWKTPSSIKEKKKTKKKNEKKKLTKKQKEKDSLSSVKTMKKIKKNIQNDKAERTLEENQTNQSNKKEIKRVESDNLPGEEKLSNVSNKSLNGADKNNKTPNKLNAQQSDGLRFLKTDQDVIELNMVDDSSEEEDDENVQRMMNIRDAFANDDVMEEFIQEKKEIVENSAPKPTDVVMPGWGDWGGAGIVVSSKRKRKNQSKMRGPKPKRKDDGKANVIISEERNEKLAMHQVSEVPFPFAKKEHFEQSIRQPIGTHWNTQSVHHKLIQPRINKNSGSVIEPIKASKSMKKKFKKDSVKATAK